MPSDPALTVVNGGVPWWVWAAPAAALVAAALILGLGRRRSRGDLVPELAGVPLEITGLTKRFRDGQLAVDDLSLRVERGQILGLLGPNGAGKTTTLRALMGLVRPQTGTITIFGRRVHPGSPALSRLGSFVEGPGFLPHLSGRANLDLYWRSTGRPADGAHLAEVLEVAGLGAAIDRRVRTYSRGMCQRLAIAQAMLGMPDLLVLDEPMNGLDPPQIREMRDVLLRYAAEGRTVILSSHLLGEVEQTCTHVVVMHEGRRLAAGPVAEIMGEAGALMVGTPEPEHAVAVLRAMDGSRGGGATPRWGAGPSRRRAALRRGRGPGRGGRAGGTGRPEPPPGGRLPGAHRRAGQRRRRARRRPGPPARQRSGRQSGECAMTASVSPAAPGPGTPAAGALCWRPGARHPGRPGLRPAPDAAAAGGGDPPAAAAPDHGGVPHPAGPAVDPGRRVQARRPGAAGQRPARAGQPRHRRRAQLRRLQLLRLGGLPAGGGGRAVLRRHDRQRGELVVAALPAGRAGAAGPAAAPENHRRARLRGRRRGQLPGDVAAGGHGGVRLASAPAARHRDRAPLWHGAGADRESPCSMS